MRLLIKILGTIIVIAAGLALWGHLNARADPIVRRVTIALPDWPAAAQPVTVALFSDVHIGNSTMDADRLARIVAQVNALRPDLVLIAGDFASTHDSTGAPAGITALAAPLSGLHPRLGTIATLGNHDEWTGPGVVRRTLEKAGITVLDNQAVQRGPLVIGGAGDRSSRHHSVPALSRAMLPLHGARIVVTHSPDLVPMLPADMSLVLAGHSHCGQIVLPLIGPLAEVTYPRYRCGVVREGARTTIVTAGVGTSIIPLRFGAPPDLWLLTLGPAAITR
ncbi:metallophosphoesterase [Sphingomonas oligophenolica]|uniref:Metallophosphoesterase n=1 Tax=Sphingomonas oligophenolica TaxID=301154 RepID=A0ABU9YCN8_9SPHN